MRSTSCRAVSHMSTVKQTTLRRYKRGFIPKNTELPSLRNKKIFHPPFLIRKLLIRFFFFLGNTNYTYNEKFRSPACEFYHALGISSPKLREFRYLAKYVRRYKWTWKVTDCDRGVALKSVFIIHIAFPMIENYRRNKEKNIIRIRV